MHFLSVAMGNLNYLLVFFISFAITCTNSYGKEINNGDSSSNSSLCRCGFENYHSSESETATFSPLYYPWAVSLFDKNGKSFCGGVLISKSEVITAARCLKGKSKDDIKLVFGVHDISKATSSDMFKIKKMITHPEFKKFPDETFEHNLGIIVIEGELPPVPNIQPICLPESSTPIPKDEEPLEPTVLGWGQITIGSSKPAQRLQMLSRPLIPVQECSNIWKKSFESNQVFCMGKYDHNICIGDEGGPLMIRDHKYRWILMGIVSYSGPVCGDKYPGVYTNIEPYMNFIHENIQFSTCSN